VSTSSPSSPCGFPSPAQLLLAFLIQPLHIVVQLRIAIRSSIRGCRAGHNANLEF